MPAKYFHIILVSSLFFISCNHKSKTSVTPIDKNVFNEEIINTICFGSCNKQWEDQSYWTQIKNENPDLWIWMGDIIYSDTEDMHQLKQQYDFQKQKAQYLDFNASVPVIGIWDDHDYGVNDGGKSYPMRKESRDLLFDFLDVPESAPEWSREGAYQSFVFGSGSHTVKVIMLDGRYFKDDLQADDKSNHRYLPDPQGSYLGEIQWKWLEQEFESSDASINLIVSGVQVIPTEHFFEKWANFPNERNRLFQLISDTDLKNPIFLSGDRHIGEVMYHSYQDQDLYEITSSGLTHSYEKADEPNKFRLGEIVRDKNFGKIEFEWTEDSVAVKASIEVIGSTATESYDWKFEK